MGRPSNKQNEILEYLTRYIQDNGHAPSIREICDAVGYEEQSYFIKVFTRFTGVTPGKFRKRGGRLDSSKERDTTVQ